MAWNPWLVGGAVLAGAFMFRSWSRGRQVADAALGYLGVPYSLGGKSMQQIDCSGLTQRAYQAVGIELPRVARDQRKVGTEVSGLGALQTGDLIYWQRDNVAHDHVGIYDGKGGVINASSVAGEVVVDPLATWMAKGWYSGGRRIL